MNLILDVLFKSGTEERYYIFIEDYINENQYEEYAMKFAEDLLDLRTLRIKTGEKQYTYLNMNNVERINIIQEELHNV